MTTKAAATTPDPTPRRRASTTGPSCWWPRSTDGGNTFAAPVKVADFYDLPDCATYQEGPEPGQGMRSGVGRDGQLDLPRDELPVGRGQSAQSHDSDHPHGLPDPEFDALFTVDRPVVFAYHGYPWLIHRLTYRRANHANFHVRGYKEEGTTTTPFDICVMNRIDRFDLAIDVIDRVPGLGERAAELRQRMEDERLRHRAYTREAGDDPPDVRDWVWPGASPPPEAATDARRGSPA